MVHVKCPKCGEIRYKATLPCEVIVDGAGQYLEKRGLLSEPKIEIGPYVCERCGWTSEELPIKTIKPEEIPA